MLSVMWNRLTTIICGIIDGIEKQRDSVLIALGLIFGMVDILVLQAQYRLRCDKPIN